MSFKVGDVVRNYDDAGDFVIYRIVKRPDRRGRDCQFRPGRPLRNPPLIGYDLIREGTRCHVLDGTRLLLLRDRTDGFEIIAEYEKAQRKAELLRQKQEIEDELATLT